MVKNAFLYSCILYAVKHNVSTIDLFLWAIQIIYSIHLCCICFRALWERHIRMLLNITAVEIPGGEGSLRSLDCPNPDVAFKRLAFKHVFTLANCTWTRLGILERHRGSKVILYEGIDLKGKKDCSVNTALHMLLTDYFTMCMYRICVCVCWEELDKCGRPVVPTTQNALPFMGDVVQIGAEREYTTRTNLPPPMWVPCPRGGATRGQQDDDTAVRMRVLETIACNNGDQVKTICFFVVCNQRRTLAAHRWVGGWQGGREGGTMCNAKYCQKPEDGVCLRNSKSPILKSALQIYR